MTQQSQAVGEGAVAVQLVGDGNTVTVLVGGMRFAHNQLHKRKATPTNINELLRTDLRGTHFVGREPERQMVAAWRASPCTISVRCVVGGAGAGKTRLAIEACEAAEKDGWFATFAASGELRRFHETQHLVHWKFPRDALIVVDYAATSQPVLLDWFAALAPHRNAGGHKLRLLLLERHASTETGWWAELTRPHSLDRDSAADLIDEKLPYVLPMLDAAEDRRALLAEVMTKAASLFDPPRRPTQPPAPGVDPGFDALLAETRPENEPLYLIMAGIHAVQHGAPAALALNQLELARDIARIERDRLAKFAQAHGFTRQDPLLAHIVACVTLQNGCPSNELADLVEQEREALRLSAALGSEHVARVICDYLPIDNGDVAPVRPDLIGESFLLPVIEGGRFRRAAVQAEIVLRAWCRKPDGVLDTLIRAAGDLAEGDASHASVRWLRAVVEKSENLNELMRIAAGVPEQTLALREFAAVVLMCVVAVVRALAEDNPHDYLPVLSAALNNLGNRLSYLGRREEALAAAEEAVALRRQLAAARPDAFTPGLAMSLNNLANFLSTLERREEALATAEEAVTLYRQLAAARPDAFTPGLAMSLNNLANFLSALERQEEALATAEEPVSLRRQLAAARPDAFTPDLAGSLNNLANALSDLQRWEEALTAADEAVALYRRLAAARPDAFTPDLAASLSNFAACLSDLGREEALATADEAVTLYRQLAAARPDAFTPNLALTLGNLAKFLSALRRPEEALAAAEEATALYRQLAAVRPDVFTPDLAMSLSVLGDMLEANERVAEAVPRGREAVSLLAPYCLANPRAFGRQMMACLRDYLIRAQAAGTGIDEALVGKILAALKDAGFLGEDK